MRLNPTHLEPAGACRKHGSLLVLRLGCRIQLLHRVLLPHTQRPPQPTRGDAHDRPGQQGTLCMLIVHHPAPGHQRVEEQAAVALRSHASCCTAGGCHGAGVLQPAVQGGGESAALGVYEERLEDMLTVTPFPRYFPVVGV